MNLKSLIKKTEELNSILMKKIEYCGISIELTYATRAKHSENWVHKSHVHPWFEYNFIAKGSVFTTLNNKEFLAEEGTSFLIPPGFYHSHRNNQTGDDGICLRFSISANSDNELAKKIVKTLSIAEEKPFISNIEKMDFSGGELSVGAMFAAWIVGIYENKISDLKVRQEYEPEKSKISPQVLIWLNEYYAKKFSVKEIALSLNMSYRNLSRKFKEETGVCISDKLLEIRMNHAKRMLISSDLTINEIAARVGFENEFYFSNVFKKYEKFSPGIYRKKVKNNQIKHLQS